MIVAIAAGAALGALGAQRNGVRFADERLLWVLGGIAGGSAAWLAGSFLAPHAALAPSAGAALVLGFWAFGSLLAALLTPRLDAGWSRTAWLASFCLKAAQSPISTALGLGVAILACAGQPRFQLRRGTCFAPVGEGRWALTLGGVVLVQKGMFDRGGLLPDSILRHESYHTRNAACLGESGFYLLYVTLGSLRALACRAPWNGLSPEGRGNPFERTAHALGREADEPPRA